jgi:hypothetical protein
MRPPAACRGVCATARRLRHTDFGEPRFILARLFDCAPERRLRSIEVKLGVRRLAAGPRLGAAPAGAKFPSRFSAFTDCRNIALALPSGRLAGALDFDSNRNRYFRD